MMQKDRWYTETLRYGIYRDRRLRGEKEKDGILAESVSRRILRNRSYVDEHGACGKFKRKVSRRDVTGSSTDTRVLYGFRLRIGLPSY